MALTQAAAIPHIKIQTMRLAQLFAPITTPLAGLRHQPVRRVLLRQIYFTGNEAVFLVLAIGFALGAIVISLLHGQYGQSRDASLRLLASLSFKEISPLLAAIILVARSSSAVASELATMQVHGEIRSLFRMGIPPGTYLIMPRVLGMTIACVGLTLYIALMSQAGGTLFSAGTDVTYEILAIDRIMRIDLMLTCLGKAFVFGLGCSLTACYVGLRVGPYVTDIPKASSRAVMRGLFVIFLIETAWTLCTI
ncbi:ABC transporter permease [Amantichitinum ursilacus]|nr:ABC transporter permease [Amantichitinum ursilacus]